MDNIIIQLGTEKGLIAFNDDETSVHYIYQNITRNYNNSEEKVQAETFCKLVLIYNYPVENIKQFVKVTVGANIKEADIIVYNDKEKLKPHIVVECKKESVSEQEFQQAINQAYAYAYATAGTVKYIWTTSGIKDAYYIVDKDSHAKEASTDIPQYKVKKLPNYKFAQNGGKSPDGQKLFALEKVTPSELTYKFVQAHQALWGGGELNPSEAFDELDKLIFCKIFDEKKERDDYKPYDFQIIKVVAENDSDDAKRKADLQTSKDLLDRLIKLYEEGRNFGERKNDPEIFKDGIKLNAAKVRTVVGYLEGVAWQDSTSLEI